MGNLFSKSTNRSPSVNPLERRSSKSKVGGQSSKSDGAGFKTEGDKSNTTRSKMPTKEKILVNDKKQEELTVKNVSQANRAYLSTEEALSDSDTMSVGVSTISKMSVKTPPPWDMARSRASMRAPTPLRSMDIDQESLDMHRDLQRVMKDRGYLSKFPSQSLLQEVKRDYRKMAIDWPEDDDGVLCPSPPKNLKRDLLLKERAIQLDEHVFSLPEEFLHQPLFDLVQYLITEANTELEEAYVMYRWLTSQALEQVITQNGGQTNVPHDYAIVVLQRLKRMSLSYTDVYTEMVGYTTIECVKITGQMKIYPKDPCESVTRTQKHSWCAIFLGREWQLVDCFLGAKIWHDTQGQRLAEKDQGVDPSESFVHDINTFYFIPDPEDLIFSHFPDRDYWQLIPRYVSKSEFQSLPYLMPEFMCLKLSSAQEKITLSTHQAMCRLDLHFPKGAGMRFSYRLRKVSKKSNTSKKASLNNFVFLENSQKHRNATFLVTLSEKGKYVLEMFGKSRKFHMEHQSHLCSYGISCNHGNSEFKGYPDNDRSEWGPGAEIEALGVTPVSHERGIVETDNGEVEIMFKVPDHLSFFQRITSYGGNTDQEYCAVHRTEKQKVVFTARPTAVGDSCLQILVKDETRKGQFTNVCNYLLRCSEVNQSVFVFPKIPQGRIGSRRELRKLGLRILSPKSSLIYSPETGRVDVCVQTTKFVLLKGELNHYVNSSSSNFSDFVVQSVDNNIVTFTLKLPKYGIYNFVMSGKRPEQKSSSETPPDQTLDADDISMSGMIPLHNILIVCNWPYKDCSEFPKLLGGWGKGCRLLCPQRKYLPAGSFLKFRLAVPEAKDVAVLDGEEWQHLQKEDGDLWEGDIMVDEDQAGSTIVVKAAIQGEYRPLLQYHILSHVDYTALKGQRKENSRQAKDRVKRLKAEKKWRDPPIQSDVAVNTDDDNVSLILLDEDTEDETGKSVTESDIGSRISEAGSKVTIESSSQSLTKTTKAKTDYKDENSKASLLESKENSMTEKDNRSTSSSDRLSDKSKTSDTSPKETKKKSSKNGLSDVDKGASKTREDLKDGSKQKDKNKTATRNKVRDKLVETEGPDSSVQREKQPSQKYVKGRTKEDGNQKEQQTKSRQEEHVKNINHVDYQHIVVDDECYSKNTSKREELVPEPRLEKKEVSFALEEDEDSDISSSAESDSEEEGDSEGSEFESWQRKTKNQAQREEEKTILDFSLPVRLLLKRLRGATLRKDKGELKSAMGEFQKKGLDERDRDFQQARRMLSVLNLRDEIVDSISKGDTVKLKIKVGDVERRGFTSEMLREMDMARARLKAADRVQRLHVQMTNTFIDVPTLAEIVRYNKPPALVHHVVQAMLLLMKYHEGKTRRWKRSHKRCVKIGTQKLYKDVHHVDIDDIDPTIAARARQILEMYAPDEAGMVSPGVGALYSWVQRVVDEVLSRHEDRDEPIKPANIQRQRRLLADGKPKAPDEYHAMIHRSTSMAAVRLRYNDLMKKEKTRSKTMYEPRSRSLHND